MVVRDTKLNTFQTSTWNTTHSRCRSNMAITPWTIVLHLPNDATLHWCGLKCFGNVCKRLTNKSSFQSQWLQRLWLDYSKSIVMMQQVRVILMEEHDHWMMCFHISKNIKATKRIIKDKIILQKFILCQRDHRIKMCWCISIQNKIHLWMKIIDKEKLNLNQWVKMTKSQNGFSWWGRKSAWGANPRTAGLGCMSQTQRELCWIFVVLIQIQTSGAMGSFKQARSSSSSSLLHLQSLKPKRQWS